MLKNILKEIFHLNSYHYFQIVTFGNKCRCLNKNKIAQFATMIQCCKIWNVASADEKYTQIENAAVEIWIRSEVFLIRPKITKKKILVLNQTADFHFHANQEIKSYIWPQCIFSHILRHKFIVRSSNKSSHILSQKSIFFSIWLIYVKYFLTVTNRTICADTTSSELLT